MYLRGDCRECLLFSSLCLPPDYGTFNYGEDELVGVPEAFDFFACEHFATVLSWDPINTTVAFA